MNDDRAALATSICSTFDMGHHHHEAFLQPDHCEDGLSDADELLRSLRAQGYSVAHSEGPGLDWRAKIAAAEEWIGWDSTFCYWCDNDQSEGHAPDCVWVAAQENPT